MGGQQTEQMPRQDAAPGPNADIAQFFAHEGEVRFQPRLRGMTGVCRFDIAGAGSWNVAVNDGEVSVIDGAGNALRADCVVTCTAEDFRRIVRGDDHLNLVTAAMQGLVTVNGDYVFAMAFLGNVVVATGVMQRR